MRGFGGGAHAYSTRGMKAGNYLSQISGADRLCIGSLGIGHVVSPADISVVMTRYFRRHQTVPFNTFMDPVSDVNVNSSKKEIKTVAVNIKYTYLMFRADYVYNTCCTCFVPKLVHYL